MSAGLNMKAIRSDSLARGASEMGQYEEAATIHARTAKMFWTAKRYSDATTSVIKASECLMEAGMPDEAFEGIRSTSIMLVGVRQPKDACRLSLHVEVLEERYPMTFGYASQPFQKFVCGLCKEHHLL